MRPLAIALIHSDEARGKLRLGRNFLPLPIETLYEWIPRAAPARNRKGRITLKQLRSGLLCATMLAAFAAAPIHADDKNMATMSTEDKAAMFDKMPDKK